MQTKLRPKGKIKMLLTKILLLTAFIGHVICRKCDSLLAYTPSGRFSAADMKSCDKMAERFEGMSLKNIMISMLLGVPALMMSGFGAFGLCRYMFGFSKVYGTIMAISAAVFICFVIAHHVFCGVTEWIFVRFDRTEESYKTVLDFFKQTAVMMYVCYTGLLVFVVTLFIAVVTGATDLPRWACIFNTLPLFIILTPFKLVGTGNIANALMYLGLFIFI